MRQRRRESRNRSTAVCAALVLATFFVGLRSRGLGEALALSHTVSIIAVAVLTLLCRKTVLSTAEGWLGIVLVAGLGAVGAFVVAGIFVIRPIIRSEGTLDLEWLFDPLSEVDEADQSKRLYRRLVEVESGRDNGDGIVPFIDVARGGTLSEKQRALNQIARNYSRRMLPALKTALQDSHSLVRIQAASTITTLDARFVEQEMRTAALLTAKPEDPALLRKLASQRLERSESGLLDTATEQRLRRKAVEDARHSVRCGPWDGATSRTMVRALLDLGLIAEARSELRTLLKHEAPRSPSTDEIALELLYRTGRYSSLRRYLRIRASRIPGLGVEHQLWAGRRSDVHHPSFQID